MTAGFPVLPGLSLYQKELDRGVHMGERALGRMTLKTPVIGATSASIRCVVRARASSDLHGV